MLIKEAKEITGGIGFTSKTGFSFGLPALTSCRTGCRLASKEGTTCSGCYAKGGNYAYNSVKTAHKNRLNAVKQLHKKTYKEKWVNAMVTLIENKAEKTDSSMHYFRWHDSGDLQGIDHLRAIVEVAKKTPNIKHWLPTKEKQTVKLFLQNERLPKNLTIRLSAYYVDKNPDFDINIPVAAVYRDNEPGKGHVCPAILQHKGCHEVGCRACWSKKVRKVNYKYHR